MPELSQEHNSDADRAAVLTRNAALSEAEKDPLLCHVALPLRAVFYPLGFAIEIVTNSQDVLNAAAESWAHLHQRHATPALQLRIGITDGGPNECPPAPVVRAQRHLLSIIADAHHQAIAISRQASHSCG